MNAAVRREQSGHFHTSTVNGTLGSVSDLWRAVMAKTGPAHRFLLWEHLGTAVRGVLILWDYWRARAIS